VTSGRDDTRGRRVYTAAYAYAAPWRAASTRATRDALRLTGTACGDVTLYADAWYHPHRARVGLRMPPVTTQHINVAQEQCRATHMPRPAVRIRTALALPRAIITRCCTSWIPGSTACGSPVPRLCHACPTLLPATVPRLCLQEENTSFLTSSPAQHTTWTFCMVLLRHATLHCRLCTSMGSHHHKGCLHTFASCHFIKLPFSQPPPFFPHTGHSWIGFPPPATFMVTAALLRFVDFFYALLPYATRTSFPAPTASTTPHTPFWEQRFHRCTRFWPRTWLATHSSPLTTSCYSAVPSQIPLRQQTNISRAVDISNDMFVRGACHATCLFRQPAVVSHSGLLVMRDDCARVFRRAAWASSRARAMPFASCWYFWMFWRQQQ